jgi:hypothetical protein
MGTNKIAIIIEATDPHTPPALLDRVAILIQELSRYRLELVKIAPVKACEECEAPR